MSQSLQRHKINRPFKISSPAGGFPLPKKSPISCKEIYNPTVRGPLPTSCCSLPHQLSGSSWQSLGSLDMLNFLLGSNHTWQSLTLECFADLEYSFLPDAPLHAPKLAVKSLQQCLGFSGSSNNILARTNNTIFLFTKQLGFFVSSASRTQLLFPLCSHLNCYSCCLHICLPTKLKQLVARSYVCSFQFSAPTLTHFQSSNNPS